MTGVNLILIAAVWVVWACAALFMFLKGVLCCHER